MKDRINSRKKGSKAERDLAKQLGVWSNKRFARTPSSGGLQWGASFAKGDIVCTTEGHYFPFCIEVKNHGEINLNELITTRKQEPKIIKFWEQCARDAKEAGKLPLLFMRYNGMKKGEWIIGIPQISQSRLPLFDSPDIPMMHLWHKLLPAGLTLIHSDMLFLASYKDIRNFLKQNKKWLRRW